MRRIILAPAAGVVSLVVLGFASDASANVPQYLTEQGRLFDGSGNPIATSVTMEFQLYTAATGGTAIWSEKQTILPDSGYFSAELGSVIAFGPGIFANAAANGQNLYLGVTVSTDAEITPRQPLQSVPYALVADNAVGDITPATVSVGGATIINGKGQWVGPGSGLVGPTGAQGSAGPTGAQGVPGPTGAQGIAGPTGAQGTQGGVGPTGAQGTQGSLGPTGDKGAQGVQGPTGTQGTQGIQGALGPTGPQGSQGSQGGIGPTGPQGAQGAQGAMFSGCATHGYGGVAQANCTLSSETVTGGGCNCGNFHTGVSVSFANSSTSWYCACADSSVPTYAYATCCH